MKRLPWLASLGGSALATLCAGTAGAQNLSPPVILPPGEEVTIYGRALQQIGSSETASEGTVG